MAEVKLTKNELRAQQLRLTQLERYLPTLQLKKAMLQLEIHSAKQKIAELVAQATALEAAISSYASLFALPLHLSLDECIRPEQIERHTENIAGVEIPILDDVIFSITDYSLMDSPPWIDRAIEELRALFQLRVMKETVEEQLRCLEKELREVSIRVNLFEKILIPRAHANIRKIKVFLGDQQLAAVAQAKVAKAKIVAKKDKVGEESDARRSH